MRTTSILLGLCFFTGALHAQEDVDPDILDIQQLQVFQQQLEGLTDTPVFNEIYIQQSGRSNQVNAQVNAERSLLSVLQLGNNNTTRLDLEALDITYSVWQEGHGNYLAEYNLGNSDYLSRLVEQSGDGNNLVIHGTNSISDEMQVKMMTGNQTVIIRNFN